MIIRNILIALQMMLALFWPVSSVHATPCDGIWQQKLEAATRLLQRPQAQTTSFFHPGIDHVYEHMQTGSWHIIWVEGPSSEPGAFILHVSDQAKWFLTGWGGVANPSERTLLRQELRGLAPGLPPILARCFAWYVTEGRYLPAPATWRNPFNSEIEK